MVRRRQNSVHSADTACPCGRGIPLGECCGVFLAGRSAPTAEQLMRSRYTAFFLGDVDYLRRTWHPSTRPARLDLDPEQHWTGLEILHTTGGGFLHAEGTVEFRAHWTHVGVSDSMHEHSRFVRENGDWLYLDADGGR
ncbi:MAG: YchJ family protein [Rhodococcus sp. (in: high G+C Gram-positive bacteria)]|uniref:YchJ family protein n=1 Tax=Rhodococcus sp. TaxID=1831 RepID=UPI003D9B8E53